MLALQNITKEYYVGDTTVQALKGLSLQFRESEFVSVLGPSGCGKTTLLNIIGGLDHYTSGDLIINGRSTKEYRDADWDAYRNHSIGFVFQSYNLIPHQSVLSNVELALTLAGISKAERKQRATDALERVGLGDQLDKKPNQMSGGQMQRVAIARALVNNPDILLADEPTGALDSVTSVQIMALLKEISKDKLVIMVTHNPDLAQEYSTRIVNLRDGEVLSDSGPCQESIFQQDASAKDKKPKKDKAAKKRAKKNSMAFLTALSLSLNNLMTKKARTLLTAFAGSIGIIGIALILSISNGTQEYIKGVEEDTLSSYPLSIESTTTDTSSMMTSIMGMQSDDDVAHDTDQVYSNNLMNEMVNSLVTEMNSNDLGSFKDFLESDESGIDAYATDIQYLYSTDLNIYKSDTNAGIVQLSPTTVLDSIGFSAMMGTDDSTASSVYSMSSGSASMTSSMTAVWKQLIGNEELLASQYDVVAGHMPQNYNEVVIIMDENNEITDYALYSMGLLDADALAQTMEDIAAGKEVTTESEETTYTYDELLNMTFKLVPTTDYYQRNGDTWTDMSDDETYMANVIESAEDIKVVGIVKPGENSAVADETGSVGYTADLMTYLVDEVNASDIVQEQKADPDTDVFTGLPFETDDASDGTASTEDIMANIDYSTLTEEQLALLQSMSPEDLAAYAAQMSPTSTSTYEDNLTVLGVSDLDTPSSIQIYPKDFDSKEQIEQVIADYNTRMTDAGDDELTIEYTDYVGMLMSSVTTIIDAISYILIAFVAISLIVSSIMIGIITYISVLERTKEIGILRAMGASKRDISRVFNAETLIIGFVSGMIGIGITLLLCIPINAIVENIVGISGIASLPPTAAVILVAISMFLTIVSGLIPSKMAAKKDPVTALRTE